MEYLYRHYGWECSPYSSKTRSYLRYKQISFQDIQPNLFHLKRVIEPKVGFLVMPIVISTDGQVLQDSSDIIDQIEAWYPSRPVYPSTPKQKLVCSLLELYADEWLPLIAMHCRWNNPINRRFAIREFGEQSLPYVPRFVSNVIGRKIATKMRSYLPYLGITKKTAPVIEQWYRELFQQLDDHFANVPFLLGSKPCTADFSLFGPLYAHVWRDPGTRSVFESFAHLDSWRQRLLEPQRIEGSFLSEDTIPTTLDPILNRMFREQFPVLIETVDRVAQYIDQNPQSERIPRGLGTIKFRIGDVVEQRTVFTYQQWMFQRPLAEYQKCFDEKQEVDTFLKKVGGYEPMQATLRHRLKRHDFRIVVGQERGSE